MGRTGANIICKRVFDGPQRILELARKSAGSRDNRISGGADAIQEYLNPGAVDELEIALALVLFGDGRRLFENLREPAPRRRRSACIRSLGRARGVRPGASQVREAAPRCVSANARKGRRPFASRSGRRPAGKSGPSTVPLGRQAARTMVHRVFDRTIMPATMQLSSSAPTGITSKRSATHY